MEIVAVLRKEWFGPDTEHEGRASAGPPWSKILGLLKGKIPQHHLEAIKELVLFGADPIFSGPKKGYKAKPYPVLRKWKEQCC